MNDSKRKIFEHYRQQILESMQAKPGDGIYESSIQSLESYLDVERQRERALTILALLKEYGLPDGGRILDLGSGVGNLVAQMDNSVGIEPDINRCLIGRHVLEIDGRIVQGIGEEMPFKDNTFDAIFASYVLEHVQCLKSVLAESHRILKKGGIMYIECPDYHWNITEGHYKIKMLPHTPKRLIKLMVQLRGFNPYFVDSLNMIGYKRLNKYLNKLGFEVIDLNRRLVREKVDTLYNARLDKFTHASFSKPLLNQMARILNKLGFSAILSALHLDILLFVIMSAYLKTKSDVRIICKK